MKNNKTENKFAELKNRKLVDLMDDHFFETNDVTIVRIMHILKDQIIDAVSNGWTAKMVHRYLVERGVINISYQAFLALLRRNNISITIKIHDKEKRKASLKELKHFLFRHGFDESMAERYLEKIEDLGDAADVLRQLKKIEINFEQDLSLQEKYNRIKKVLKKMVG